MRDRCWAGQVSLQVRLWLWAGLASWAVNSLLVSPVWGQEATAPVEPQAELLPEPLESSPEVTEQLGGDRATGLPAVSEIPQLSQLESPATTVTDWIAQIEASLTQITGVEVAATEAGLQVVLAAEGELATPTTQTIGNALIADIPNAVLATDEVFEANPAEGIALVEVTGLPGDRVRVAITGTDAPPVAEVTTTAEGLALAVRLGDAEAIADAEAIEVVVTGEQDEGYNPSSASTATRTDTPLRDVPQSIQIIPQQVLEDQNVTRLQDALRNNAPGVSNSFGQNQNFIIRGFQQSFNLRNGFRTSSAGAPFDLDLADVERVEVLRGPASVLFGQLQPGGVVNIVTEQPLSEPYYSLHFTGGQFSFYRPELDFSDSLTDDGNLRYRLNAAYQNYGSFRDFWDKERFFVSPVLQWNIGEDTTLTVDLAYTYTDSLLNYGVVALSDGSLVLPIDRTLSYPSLDTFTEQQIQASYRFEHEFSDNWQIRNGFSYSRREENGTYTAIPGGLTDDRFLETSFDELYFLVEDYQLQTDLIGEFSTGSIQHQLLAGFELSRATNGGEFGRVPLPPIDIFNPNYDVARPDIQSTSFGTTFTSSLGIYLQDQIDITDDLHLLIGGRIDFSEQYTNPGDSSQNDTAFSPRVGIVYQPIEFISLYASYSRSFNPVIGRSRTNSLFEPERGTQYEIGIKTDITDTLFATLAAFEITRNNVLTPDPDNINFSIQTGEQRSRGIEFIVQGEILPGWSVIGGYAYTDARVTEDNSIPEGDLLLGVPENAANLWTTYEIQRGDLQGLGFGFGLVFVDERQGDFPNSNFQVPNYVRADAALFYRRENLRAAINVNNLFDTEYYEAAASRTNVYPGAPFNVQATVSYEF